MDIHPIIMARKTGTLIPTTIENVVWLNDHRLKTSFANVPTFGEALGSTPVRAQAAKAGTDAGGERHRCSKAAPKGGLRRLWRILQIRELGPLKESGTQMNRVAKG